MNKKAAKKESANKAGTAGAGKIIAPRAPYNTKKHRELVASRIPDELPDTTLSPTERVIDDDMRWKMVCELGLLKSICDRLDVMDDDAKGRTLQHLNHEYRKYLPLPANKKSRP